MSLKFSGPLGLGVPIYRGSQQPIFRKLTGVLMTLTLLRRTMLLVNGLHSLMGLFGSWCKRIGLRHRWPQSRLTCLVVRTLFLVAGLSVTIGERPPASLIRVDDVEWTVVMVRLRVSSRRRTIENICGRLQSFGVRMLVIRLKKARIDGLPKATKVVASLLTCLVMTWVQLVKVRVALWVH